MKGHIEEREGKTKTSFRYKLPNGRNSVTGKKDYYTSPCYATWEGADAAMKLHIATLTQERALKQIYSIYPSAHLVLPGARPALQQAVPGTTMIVEELVDKWLKSAEIKDQPSTIRGYSSLAFRYIVPKLGNIPLRDLDQDDVQDWVRYLQTVGSKGEKLRASTIRRYLNNLRTMLNFAMKELRVLDDNPASRVALPPAENRQRPGVSPEQVKAILDAIEGKWQRAGTFIAFHTGLRINEILGLHWNCIDFDAGTLDVKGSVAKNLKGELFLGPPKSRTSRRTISMNAATMDLLKEYAEQQRRDFAAVGQRWSRRGKLFSTERDSYIPDGQLRDPFKEAAEQLGYGSLTFHDTRHAHATILLKAGVGMKVVSQRLGHANISITLDLYAHVLEGMDSAAAEAFDDELA